VATAACSPRRPSGAPSCAATTAGEPGGEHLSRELATRIAASA
jgi:hypothetical protein